MNERLISLAIKDNAFIDFFVQLTKRLEDFSPVQIAVVFTESAGIVVRISLPHQSLRLVHCFLLEAVTCLVSLKGVTSNLRVEGLLTLVVDSQVQNRVCHHLLINVLKVLKHHGQKLVVKGVEVA